MEIQRYKLQAQQKHKLTKQMPLHATYNNKRHHNEGVPFTI